MRGRAGAQVDRLADVQRPPVRIAVDVDPGVVRECGEMRPRAAPSPPTAARGGRPRAPRSPPTARRAVAGGAVTGEIAPFGRVAAARRHAVAGARRIVAD